MEKPSSKHRPPLPSANRPLFRLLEHTLSVHADMQAIDVKISSMFESTQKYAKLCTYGSERKRMTNLTLTLLFSLGVISLASQYVHTDTFSQFPSPRQVNFSFFGLMVTITGSCFFAQRGP